MAYTAVLPGIISLIAAAVPQPVTIGPTAQHALANPWLFKYPPYFLPSNPAPPQVQVGSSPTAVTVASVLGS